MGQPIRVSIQRHFGTSCVCIVYFLRKYTYFHEMKTECQRIDNYHSFLTVLLIYRKYKDIVRLLDPWSLPDCFIIATQFLPGMLKLWCWNYSLHQRMKTWTLLQRYTLLLLFSLHWMNLQKYFSLKLNKYDLPDPTHQMFCLFCGVQRYLLVYIPPHKGKTVQATTFIWAYFLQMNLHLLTTNPPPPKCFNQVNKIWQCKDTILPIIYYIK